MNFLKETFLGLWEREPALMVGAASAAVVAGLALAGLAVPVATVSIVVTVLLSAVVTRLKVTPVPPVKK